MARVPCVSGAYTEPDNWMCSREALEVCMLQRPEWLAEDLLGWRHTLALAGASSDPGEVFIYQGKIYTRDPPEGTDWMAWGRWVERRLTEGLEQPDTLRWDLADVYGTPRRFGDEGLAEVAADPIPQAKGRWPTAAEGFSEFFGAGSLISLDLGWDQMRMLTSRSPEWRATLAGECDELLRFEDDTLRATVVALGSIVVPAPLRLRTWLTWMAWRIREFDWS